MRVKDVSETVKLAINASNCDDRNVKQPPRRLSDNGPAYIADNREKWLKKHSVTQLHGEPMHLQTRGKIGRWHKTLKNGILIENHFYPEHLEQQVEAFVDYYNKHRYHETLNNRTTADIYHGGGEKH